MAFLPYGKGTIYKTDSVGHAKLFKADICIKRTELLKIILSQDLKKCINQDEDLLQSIKPE